MRSTKILRVGVTSLAFGFVLALGAASAQAGEFVTTVHQLKIKGKVLFEDGDKVKSQGFGNKDIQELCCGEFDKDNDVFVVFADACLVGPGLDANDIQVRNKDTGAVVKEIGHITIGSPTLTNEKGGDLKSVTALSLITLDCDGVSVEFIAPIEVRFDGDGCADGAKFGKGAGGGTIEDENVVVEKAKAKAGKDRSDKFAPEP